MGGKGGGPERDLDAHCYGRLSLGAAAAAKVSDPDCEQGGLSSSSKISGLSESPVYVYICYL